MKDLFDGSLLRLLFSGGAEVFQGDGGRDSRQDDQLGEDLERKNGALFESRMLKLNRESFVTRPC